MDCIDTLCTLCIANRDHQRKPCAVLDPMFRSLMLNVVPLAGGNAASSARAACISRSRSFGLRQDAICFSCACAMCSSVSNKFSFEYRSNME